MKTQKKKKYVKPEVKKISLDAKCAVLGFCKTSGSEGLTGTGCGDPLPCTAHGS
jgi:hypothetical protein